ncbi:hypothetical protein K7X08_021469 [Anisodus acutangulus]|uniref:DUF7788 domain-containing protein n=1 Tax=Anisodus acutangulus TaxID=402998 RepID=A0A9Q1RDD9_9SOLA|nr:hypothetical protein K7X08_021469 [Anisodus acutangulus]
MLEILYRFLEGDEVRKNEKTEWMKKKQEGFLESLKEKKDSSIIPKGKAKKIQREKTLAKAEKLLGRYTEDYDFQFLYDKVSGFFADALWEDIELSNEGKFYELSLSVKWCPTLDSSYDKSLLMCESVGRKLFPRDADDYIHLEDDAHYAYRGKLSEGQMMIKRLFVFSDMGFVEAPERPWETDYQVIQRKFKEKGYYRVPEIVFWNLRNSKATPVPSNQQGVALVSGFFEKSCDFEAVMMQAISGDEYQKLVVFD